MTARLVVATECPTCGAPLDFGEGTNAIRCAHCRSNLLVTGRKRVLSFFLPPKTGARDALAIARFAQPLDAGPFRLGEPELRFLPYYRLTGDEFRWQRPAPAVKPAPADPSGMTDFSRELAFLAAVRSTDEVDAEGAIAFNGRRVEKNFLAGSFHDVAPHSLGVRPSVLRLELFRRDALERLGRIVSPQLDVESALALGLRSAGTAPVIYRAVVGRLLALVYFPFWLVPVERTGRTVYTVLDAVAQSPFRLDVASAAVERLGRPSTSDAATIGFRPLACPNCGWDLPLEPDAVVFPCGACDRAWEIHGQELHEVAARVAELDEHPAAKHLPFWVVRFAATAAAQQRYFVPAFRFRLLKSLNDLAVNLSRKGPALRLAAPRETRLHPVYFDREDAAALARFAAIELRAGRIARVRSSPLEGVEVEEADLVWIPFQSEPSLYRDPFTGTAVASNLLL